MRGLVDVRDMREDCYSVRACVGAKERQSVRGAGTSQDGEGGLRGSVRCSGGEAIANAIGMHFFLMVRLRLFVVAIKRPSFLAVYAPQSKSGHTYACARLRDCVGVFSAQ